MENVTRFEDREFIKIQHFNKGLCLKLCPEGKGYAVRLAQFNGEIKSMFSFDLVEAEKIFDKTAKLLKK